MKLLYNKILRETLDIMDFDSWDDSEQVFKDDIENSLKSAQLVYKINIRRGIKIFEQYSDIWIEFKDKVYINGEHVQLKDGYTVNKYEPGEYKVYIEDFDKLEEIYEDAFHETSLISIIIPNSVISIGASAFFDCYNLTSVTIPNSVKEIGGSAFAGCYNLASIMIPSSVTMIGPGAFLCCRMLKKVYTEDIEKFKRIQFCDGYANPTWYDAELIELKNGLNEAFDIMDFDSWDDSEQTFKEDIKNTLDYSFTYRFGGVPATYKIINTSYRHSTTKLAILRISEKYNIPLGSYIYKKYQDKIYINGIKEPLSNQGYIINTRFIPEINQQKTNEYQVVIEGIEDMHGIYDSFFYDCKGLVKVPAKLKKLHVVATASMFAQCSRLQSVPLFDVTELIETGMMFYRCPYLDDETKEKWNINSWGDARPSEKLIKKYGKFS